MDVESGMSQRAMPKTEDPPRRDGTRAPVPASDKDPPPSELRSLFSFLVFYFFLFFIITPRHHPHKAFCSWTSSAEWSVRLSRPGPRVFGRLRILKDHLPTLPHPTSPPYPVAETWIGYAYCSAGPPKGAWSLFGSPGHHTRMDGLPLPK